MKQTPFRRILSMLLVFVMLISLFPSIQATAESPSGASWKESDQQITLDQSDRLANLHLDDRFEPTELVRVSIVLEEKSTIEAGFSTFNIASNAQAMAYNRNLLKKQESIEKTISKEALDGEPLDVVWNLTLVGNIISANVPFGKIALIEQVKGVAGVVLENMYEPHEVETEDDVVVNQFAVAGMTGFNTVWSNGYTGAGSRIAVIDTGTDTDHQSFDNGAFLYALEQNALAAGVDVDEYIAGLNLLSVEELADILPSLNIYEKDNTLTADDLYLTEKLAFAVNYVDSGEGRLHVDHHNDYQGAHGSHVAGISTANRYIPSGDGYVDALNAVHVAGVAPDAQLITMKVFGNAGLRDSDYMAAIEDAILLGCDSVNLSLGTVVPGHAFNSYYAELLDYMTETDTVVVASAGNEGTWTATTTFGLPYSDDVTFDAIGAPGSYTNFFTVASVNNDGVVGMIFSVGDLNVMYIENTSYGNAPLASIDTSADGSGTTYDYVFIDGLGKTTDYEGIDLTNKVVFCSRGELNFAVKANNAASLGAAAIVVYNNQAGSLGMDLSGYTYTAPCISILQAEANYIRSISDAQTTEGGLTYYTGKIDIFGAPQAAVFNSEYYTMSDFSSWGVPGDLSIKPEITAPGGLIYSIYGSSPELSATDAYGLMSGTSMAAPQVTGMVALLAQYMRQAGLANDMGISPRVLAQSLLMSTAVPMLDESTDSYFPIMQQGAGLARVDLATLARTYIMVAGQEDGKVKAELGDDPKRTGVYEFTFTINNMTGKAQDYALTADMFRQGVFDPGELQGTPYGFTMQDTSTVALASTAVFTVNGQELIPEAMVSCDLNGDGTTNALDADYLLEYLLGNETELHANGDVSGDGKVNTYDAHYLLMKLEGPSIVTVPADASVTVEVQLVLTDNAKEELDAKFADGAYIQAYVFAEEITGEEGVVGTNHSIPVLAFYGNWTDPNMFDRGVYIEMMYGISDLIPYLYQVIGNGNALTIDYGDGNEYYFGGNPIMNDTAYLPERNAFNSEDDSYLLAQYFTLIRNAGDAKIEIVDKETGEVYFSNHSGELYSAFYNSSYGTWENTMQSANLFWTGTDAKGSPLPEGTVVEVILTAAPEYYRKDDGTYDYEALGHGASLVTQLTIDNTAPELIDFSLDTEETPILTVSAKDNEYIAAAVLLNKTGSVMLAAGAANQTKVNTQMDIALDLTDVTGNTFLLAVYDYAMNVNVYEIELDLPEIERPYFTAIDYTKGIYYGLSANGDTVALGISDRQMAMAAEFVDGYVFEVAGGEHLYVAEDSDLNSFEYLGSLDPNGQWAITTFVDLAYNYANGKLYGLFYSELNGETLPVLCTIDMFTAEMKVLTELPIDVNNMAIDGAGNFYSVGYNSTTLYTYTLNDLANGTMNKVGDVGYYYTDTLNSLAWDHNTQMLYWAYPNTLLMINPKTAEPTLLSYFQFTMVGMYIRPESYPGTKFDPVDKITSVSLDYSENRIMVGSNVLLSATVRPWNTTDDSVTWSSADESIATVDENGMVTGVSVGTTVITATSKLDPSKSASCTIHVITLEKTLNGLIWDAEGKIWWSEFEVSGLPNYIKIQDTPVDEYLAATAFTPDGKLYAASTDLSTGYLSSSLFTVDPETFEITKIGDSEYGYSDIAYAPHLRGGSIMGTYGPYLMVIDPTTGELAGENSFYYMFSNGLVALAYAGSDPYTEYGFNTYIDWFFLIDAGGYVYLMGFLADDAGNLYYFEHPATTGGIFTIVNYTCDVEYFSSAHFDGEFLYWSAYNEAKNVSTLFAIDTSGSRKTYVLGDFGAGIWPAGGLCELDNPTAGMGLSNYELLLEPKAAENAQLKKLSVTDLSVPTVEPEKNATSRLPALDLTSIGQVDKQTEQFTLELTTADIATNGTMQVTYDPATLELESVTGVTEAFAYTVSNGIIQIAFAEAVELAADATVATLVFNIIGDTDSTVTVEHDELNKSTSDKVEQLPVRLGLLGDVNGDGYVNATDAMMILRYSAGILTEEEVAALNLDVADFDENGTVNATDAMLVLRKSAGVG